MESLRFPHLKNHELEKTSVLLLKITDFHKDYPSPYAVCLNFCDLKHNFLSLYSRGQISTVTMQGDT